MVPPSSVSVAPRSASLAPFTRGSFAARVLTHVDDFRAPAATDVNSWLTYTDSQKGIEAVEQGKISPLRYESYLTLLTSVEAEHMRR